MELLTVLVVHGIDAVITLKSALIVFWLTGGFRKVNKDEQHD